MMTPEEAGKFLRQIAETTAEASKNWNNFEKIAVSMVTAALEAGKAATERRLQVVTPNDGEEREILVRDAAATSDRARAFLLNHHPNRQWVEVMRDLRVTLDQCIEALRADITGASNGQNR